MSAADFLLSSEVQKILKLVLAEPATAFSAAELAKRTKLSLEDVARTREHLVKSGILVERSATSENQEGVGANTSFVFYNELRAIALKSFAAAEPIRAMLRTKFKDSVLRAVVLGEDDDGTIELLVVHGQQVPDQAAMTSACTKLSAAIGRHLKVHVVSSAKYSALDQRDALGAKLHAGAGFEIIAAGETKARPAQDQGGLIEGARKRLTALVRGL
jgi:DNA-binding Lrp family transcriptional regulator